MTTHNQPLDNITWTTPDQLHSNDYNPNHVAPPEMQLLKTSILEDGWTQPIVARKNGEIVDGFHRWTTSHDPEVAALTDGKIPVVYLNDKTDPASQRMSTIRHNRARGTHGVKPMANIVNELHHEYGLDIEEIGTRLQMEWEEVDRLLDYGEKPKRGSNPDGFNKGWKPTKKKPA